MDNPRPVDPQVVLTEAERELFQAIRETCQVNQLDTVVRVAGGWVRDKLLGKALNDVDLALDNCTGEFFAERFRAFLGLDDTKIGKAKQNPEKSKHLETAFMNVMGFSLDFVNLRTETYGEDDSRVPDRIEFGTPIEDAFRRDLQ